MRIQTGGGFRFNGASTFILVKIVSNKQKTIDEILKITS